MSDQNRRDTHGRFVAPAPAWRVLRIAAEIYADFQQFRIAAVNRAQRGGVDPQKFAGLIEGVEKQEAQLKLYLRDAYRAAVPKSIRDWEAATDGLGEHTFARLLGILGDPRTAHPWHWEGKGKCPRPVNSQCACKPQIHRHLVSDEPYERSVSQLWSYCGVGDPTRKRRHGMEVDDALACGSPRLRSLLFVIAGRVAMLDGEPDKNGRARSRSPYRNVYDNRRLTTVDRVHAEPCIRCGPSGKPAEAGSPWSKAHQHYDGLRIVAKEILKDLWRVAGEGAINEAEPMAQSPLPAASQDGEPASSASEAKSVTPAAVLAEATP